MLNITTVYNENANCEWHTSCGIKYVGTKKRVEMCLRLHKKKCEKCKSLKMRTKLPSRKGRVVRKAKNVCEADKDKSIGKYDSIHDIC